MRTFLPGSTIGILGSGQLGRMTAIAARQLGYRVHVFSPDRASPAGQVADREWSAPFADGDALAEFARHVDVVTTEFENVPADTLAVLERHVPVHPGPEVYAVAQNRFREKSRLNRIGLPTAPFRLVRSASELAHALRDFGGEGILKTTTSGYDGKGQRRITAALDLAGLWDHSPPGEYILEGIVDFSCEFSVIGVRGADGEVRCYDPVLNHHRNHILDVSLCPADPLLPALRSEAMEMTRQVLQDLEVIGLVCVEFFADARGRAIINEIAPRPHNSGHLTIEAHHCSQFEQHVRSVCGLPLGSVQQRQPAAMANLLGDLWEGRAAPDWVSLLRRQDVKLHLYGKLQPSRGRKMGHVTALATTAADAERSVREARAALTGAHAPQHAESMSG